MKNIVIAAGYATRLGELTKNFPKPLLKIGEKSILGRMLDDIDQIPEIDEHIIVTNHKFAPIFEQWAKEQGQCSAKAEGQRDSVKAESQRDSVKGTRSEALDLRPLTFDLRQVDSPSTFDRRWQKPITIIDDGTSTNDTRLGAVCDLLLALERIPNTPPKQGEKEGVKRFMLPDTLGVMNPLQVIEYFRKMIKRYPKTHFDFHAHNDYDLAVSNSLAAVYSGARGLHVTVNGLGERCGNAPMASVQAILKDQFHAKTNIVESQLNDLSRMVESFSGITVAPNQPIVGENVFTQVAGVHADGDTKDKLYYNELMPERFGRKREYALGKNSGKANIAKNLEELGLELTPEQTRRVTERITELGDKKEIVTQEDLPFIVSDVLKHDSSDDKVKLISYVVSTAYGLRPGANVKVEINGQQYEAAGTGDGQYDAFVKALRYIYKKYLDRTFPILANYQVTIPPGGRTDALVQTVITWNDNGKMLRTRGLDADQTEAAIKATFKMLNIIENEITK